MEYEQRPWVEKFKTGEYLNKWNGYDTILIGGGYSESLSIGEDKFQKCIGEFNGIGDVSWWVKKELDKLSPMDLEELKLICEYKTYLGKFISFELVEKLSELFGCDKFHIFRTGDKKILELCNELSEYTKCILASSNGCLDQKTIDFKGKKSIFEVMSYDDYKIFSLRS